MSSPREKPSVQPAPVETERTAPPKSARQSGGGAFPFAPKSKPPPPPAPEIEPQPLPREGREFPCSQCGAALHFDPNAQSLKCGYCGHAQDIPQDESQVQELCFKTYFEAGRVAEEVLAGAEGERRCDGCGAMVIVTAQIATDHCPFCGTHLTTPVESPTPMMRPGAVLPFAIDKPKSKEHFKHWVRTRWFAPNAFKKMAELDRVNGLYVPYWTYDAMTWSFYTGQRGDAYYVTVGSGKNRRSERRVRWTSVAGRVNHWFDDVLICASKSLPDKLVQGLEPWDLKHAQTYDPGYLGGFRTERYQISSEQGFDIARATMDSLIRDLVKRDIGGDEQRISSIRTHIDGVTFKLLLLPIWLAAYRFHEETYRVLINARTGEVQGQRPWSIVKITLAVVTALIILIPIIGMIMKYAE